MEMQPSRDLCLWVWKGVFHIIVCEYFLKGVKRMWKVCSKWYTSVYLEKYCSFLLLTVVKFYKAPQTLNLFCEH